MPLFTWEVGGATYSLDADSVTSAMDERVKEMTQYAIEDGSTITDHLIHKPNKLKLVLAQTQTPIRPGGGFTSRPATVDVKQSPERVQVNTSITVARNPLALPLSANAVLQNFRAQGTPAPTSFPSTSALGDERPSYQHTYLALQAGQDQDRIQDFYQALLGLFQNSYPVQVVFRDYKYESMIVTGVKWDSAPGQVGIGRFTVDLQQLSTVTTAQVDLPTPAASVLDGTRGLGNAPSKPMTNAEKQGVLRSVLKAGGTTYGPVISEALGSFVDSP